MGIFSSLVKVVSWGKVASLAMEYGPLLFKQVKLRMQQVEGLPQPVAAEIELNERLGRLEKLLLEQERVISGQAAKNSLLEEQCRKLEAQLGSLKIVTAFSVGITLLLLVLLIMRW